MTHEEKNQKAASRKLTITNALRTTFSDLDRFTPQRPLVESTLDEALSLDRQTGEQDEDSDQQKGDDACPQQRFGRNMLTIQLGLISTTKRSILREG